MTYRLQARFGNRAYRTVDAAPTTDALAWALQQWTDRTSSARAARIVDVTGKVILRAVRKRDV